MDLPHKYLPDILTVMDAIILTLSHADNFHIPIVMDAIILTLSPTDNFQIPIVT